jgi:hypothetical protein
MLLKTFIVIILACILFQGCNTDSPVNNNNTVTNNYVKINTIERGDTKFELWSATGNILYYGYNDIGFKVYVAGAEKKTGTVMYQPKMYHFIGSPWHSSPVSRTFSYDSDKQLFTGYVSFMMISDSTGWWVGDYNYNNETTIDSVGFTVTTNSTNQMRIWDDLVGGHTYVLSLIEPMNAKVGLNTISCMLHETNNHKSFTEVNGAGMFITTWMPSHGHGSSNNVNPSFLGSGKYSGKVNFSMSGGWDVYDSIYYNGGVITKSPSPKFSFDAY